MSILSELSESRLYPSRRSLQRESFYSISDTVYLLILTLRIILCERVTEDWAMAYLKKTIRPHFTTWRTDGTDLYVALFALMSEEYGGSQRSIDDTQLRRWLKALLRDPRDEQQTRRFFLRLDSLLGIDDSSMKAIRRLVMDWPDLKHHQKQLAMTRLLQMIRSRIPRTDMGAKLQAVARAERLELNDVCNAESGDCDEKSDGKLIHAGPPAKTGPSFLAQLAGFAAGYAGARMLGKLGEGSIEENATSGSTSAASVATVVGGLGAGFDPKGDKGIYQGKKPAVIRRK